MYVPENVEFYYVLVPEAALKNRNARAACHTPTILTCMIIFLITSIILIILIIIIILIILIIMSYSINNINNNGVF